MPRANKKTDDFIGSVLSNLFIDCNPQRNIHEPVHTSREHLTMMTVIVACLCDKMSVSGYTKAATNIVRVAPTPRLLRLIAERFFLYDDVVHCQPRHPRADVEEYINTYYLNWKLLLLDEVLRT